LILCSGQVAEPAGATMVLHYLPVSSTGSGNMESNRQRTFWSEI